MLASAYRNYYEDRVSVFRDEFLAQPRMDCPEALHALVYRARSKLCLRFAEANRSCRDDLQ
jgi:hypothetical protein